MGIGIRARRRSANTSRFAWAVYALLNGNKGDDTGTRVKSDSLDYPLDGVSGNAWYVLIKADGASCVWLQYTTGYAIDESAGGKSVTSNHQPNYDYYYGTSYKVNINTGKISLVNYKLTTTPSNMPVGTYYLQPDEEEYTNGTTVRKIKSNSTISDGRSKTVTTEFTPKRILKNTATGQYVTGYIGDFPDNGVQGDYYYVRTTPDNEI